MEHMFMLWLDLLSKRHLSGDMLINAQEQLMQVQNHLGLVAYGFLFVLLWTFKPPALFEKFMIQWFKLPFIPT